ncbi:hypothetical protein BD413DRAFT_77656 [Trametes elegans]|nr:hypothetical protein BD413DRAFT_77656 [Trametes elegans]
MSETGEGWNIDVLHLDGLGGAVWLPRLWPSVWDWASDSYPLDDSLLLGEPSSRMGSQIDRRSLSRSRAPPPTTDSPTCSPTPSSCPTVSATLSGAPAPPSRRPRSPPRESRPIADELDSASGHNHSSSRPSSAHADQRACISQSDQHLPYSLQRAVVPFQSSEFPPSASQLVSTPRIQSGKQAGIRYLSRSRRRACAAHRMPTLCTQPRLILARAGPVRPRQLPWPSNISGPLNIDSQIGTLGR